jgi:serine-type D-Ala-D-Ala carboxypeptidase (penicillin-binding protein 5/6)
MHNTKTVFPIASLSKLVTALVALHNMSPDQKITITKKIIDDGYGEAGHLASGETFTISEILYPLLLESSNDAAEALAQSYGYADFIAKMNAFTGELNMASTSFKDPSGLSSGNVSNAEDLLILARYIYTREEPLLELTRQINISVATTTEHNGHTWNTINPFPLDPHFMGGKTGKTNEAKESMVSLFRYVHKNISYPVVIIVLRSDFKVREKDSEYLFEKFIQKIDKK